MGCKASIHTYDAEGKPLGSHEIFLPEFLDWMPIQLKTEWIRFMGGPGHPDTNYALFKSQGEQLLVIGITLANLDHKSYLEKLDGSEKHCEEFARQHGIVRTPRNQ